jgi:hypothetical protein
MTLGSEDRIFRLGNFPASESLLAFTIIMNRMIFSSFWLEPIHLRHLSLGFVSNVERGAVEVDILRSFF